MDTAEKQQKKHKKTLQFPVAFLVDQIVMFIAAGNIHTHASYLAYLQRDNRATKLNLNFYKKRILWAKTSLSSSLVPPQWVVACLLKAPPRSIR